MYRICGLGHSCITAANSHVDLTVVKIKASFARDILAIKLRVSANIFAKMLKLVPSLAQPLKRQAEKLLGRPRFREMSFSGGTMSRANVMKLFLRSAAVAGH